MRKSPVPGSGSDDPDNGLTRNAGTTQAHDRNESLQTVGAATVGSDADWSQQKGDVYTPRVV